MGIEVRDWEGVTGEVGGGETVGSAGRAAPEGERHMLSISLRTAMFCSAHHKNFACCRGGVRKGRKRGSFEEEGVFCLVR